MTTETVTLEYEGDEWEFSVEVYEECENCGFLFNEPDTGPLTCPGCGERAARARYYKRDFYSKEAWWQFEDPPNSAEQHAEALREMAQRVEAFAANGWDVTDADGERIFFRKDLGTETPENPNKVNDSLQ